MATIKCSKPQEGVPHAQNCLVGTSVAAALLVDHEKTLDAKSKEPSGLEKLHVHLRLDLLLSTAKIA